MRFHPPQYIAVVRSWTGKPCEDPHTSTCLPCAAREFDVEFEFAAGWRLIDYAEVVEEGLRKTITGRVAIWMAARSTAWRHALFAKQLRLAVKLHRDHQGEHE